MTDTEQGKHTPGPWAVNPFAAQVDAFNENGGATVCELLWPTEVRSEAETEANARLIAAAPDLLAALKALRRYITIRYSEFGEVLNEGAVTDLATIDAAIAKAEGRSASTQGGGE